MASIVKKKKSFCVVYTYIDEKGNKKQKWETFKTMADAKKRKSEVEYQILENTLVVPKCITVDELLDEYVELYGKSKFPVPCGWENCWGLPGTVLIYRRKTLKMVLLVYM